MDIGLYAMEDYCTLTVKPLRLQWLIVYKKSRVATGQFCCNRLIEMGSNRARARPQGDIVSAKSGGGVSEADAIHFVDAARALRHAAVPACVISDHR